MFLGSLDSQQQRREEEEEGERSIRYRSLEEYEELDIDSSNVI